MDSDVQSQEPRDRHIMRCTMKGRENRGMHHGGLGTVDENSTGRIGRPGMLWYIRSRRTVREVGVNTPNQGVQGDMEWTSFESRETTSKRAFMQSKRCARKVQLPVHEECLHKMKEAN